MSSLTPPLFIYVTNAMSRLISDFGSFKNFDIEIFYIKEKGSSLTFLDILGYVSVGIFFGVETDRSDRLVKSPSGIGGFLLCILDLVNLLSFGSGCSRNR